jgi:predicted GIY-YIG superfamily endonuclease
MNKDCDEYSAHTLGKQRHGYVVYLLSRTDAPNTYVGSTNCLWKRMRQHRGEINGGARTTSRWRGNVALVGFVAGFESHSQALSFEWFCKRSRVSSLEHASGRSERASLAADFTHDLAPGVVRKRIRTIARVLGTSKFAPCGLQWVPKQT